MDNRFIDVGFKKVGQWKFQNGRLQYSLSIEATSSNILYSFVSSDDVLYIGKTTNTLESRMYQYQNPGPSQHTNIRVNSLLSEMLSRGATVDIYALPDNGSMKYRGFHVNLAAGIEDSLIHGLKPKWNKMGK